MSPVILCLGKRAEIPYCIPVSGINVYSVEELCYFFGENAFLLDDGIINKHLVEWLEEQFAVGKPMMLLIHIPIVTKVIMDPVRQKWGEGGPEYFLLGKPHDTALSRRFCHMLADPSAPIKAVFAGHIHLQHAGEIIPGRMQYVSGPVFEGTIRKYVLKPE